MKGVTVVVYILATLAAQKQIDIHVNNLGAESYYVRQSASRKLTKIGKPAIARLEYEVENNSDLEIRSRSKRIVDRFYDVRDKFGNKPSIYQLSEKQERELVEVFELDCLLCYKTAETIYPWVEAHGLGVDYADYSYHIERIATQVFVLKMLDNGWYREDIVDFLTEMSGNPRKKRYR
jgi:hypothetical protein